jgi:protein SCO1/2
MRNVFGVKTLHPAIAAILMVLLCLAVLAGCRSTEPLPVLGTIDIPYTFIDQDNQRVSSEMYANRILVADFFFTTCPTICPIMKSQMLRVYETFKGNDQVVLLSHTIDPEHDTVAVLDEYAARLGIDAIGWHMVTGNKEEIYDTAYRFGLAAMEDERAPGGFIHSGSFTLVDRQGKIRGYYQGTEDDPVNQLIKDIRRLLDEK